jgi:hypothetical protein
MSGNLSSLENRLAKLQQKVADLAPQVESANCNCEPIGTLALSFQPEQFEAEMNLPCPAHGFRRLGMILKIRFVDGDGRRDPTSRLEGSGNLRSSSRSGRSRTCIGSPESRSAL